MESSIPHLDPGTDDFSSNDRSANTPPDVEITLEEMLSSNVEFDIGSLSHNMKLYKTLQSSSYSSLVPYQIPQVCDILKLCFPGPVKHIVDATAHIGGDSILFANVFGGAKITCIDSDPDAVECLTHNITNFSDPRRFEIIRANSVEWIRNNDVGHADFYYFDPPWGGPKYYAKREIDLHLDSFHISEVVNMVFSLKLAEKVLLKIPRNFAYPTFKTSVKGVCRLFYIKKPQKNGSIAYGLIFITSRDEEI
jgi:predicted RNA methylase